MDFWTLKEKKMDLEFEGLAFVWEYSSFPFRVGLLRVAYSY